MKSAGGFSITIVLLVSFGLVLETSAGWFTQEEKNDTQSRMLNEMTAKPRTLPPAADPRDARIAALEKQIAGLENEVAQLRSTAGRGSDLERQLADQDRELASLRAAAGDSSNMAGQLSAAQSDLAAANTRTADLERRLAAAQSESAATQSQLAALQAGAGADRNKLAAECTDAKQRVADLEKRLADREKELVALRGDLSTEMAKLKEAQRGVIRALRPQIEKGNIMVDLNNERLLINLASSYLFGSGEDQLKPRGADALKQVGSILKDFPEYKVAVDGHTDNRPIRSELKKRFPTNQELSEARATNAAKALTAGGLTVIETHGYADTRPVMPNTTDAGRAKNRRVEVRVTK